MAESEWRIATKYRAITGAVFLVLPIGIPWYFGNLATYTTSYFKMRSDPNSDDVDPTWMLSVFFLGLGTGQVASGTAASKIGLLKSFFISSILFDLGIFTSYFSVQHSVALTLVTSMAIPGFFGGVILALAFSVAADWFRGKHVGAASSVVSVAFSTGAIVYNEMTTHFINPTNLTPYRKEGNMVYFSQMEILDRYPSVFVAIGVVSVVFQLVAVPLIEIPPIVSPEKDDKNSNNLKVKGISGDSSDLRKQRQIGDKEQIFLDTIEHDPEDDKEIANFNNKSNEYYNTVNCNIVNTSDSPNQNNDILPIELSPMEAISTKVFHVLWFSSFSIAFGYLVVNNYYKLFGQIWIENDSFLTTTGSTATISGAVMRIAVGIAADEAGLKITMTLIAAANTVFLSFWYLSVLAGKWFYLIFTNCLSGLFSSSFILFPIATIRFFGHAHFPTIYGLVTSSTLLANVMAPLVFPVVLSRLGWSSLFSSVSGFSALVVVAVVFFLPK